MTPYILALCWVHSFTLVVSAAVHIHKRPISEEWWVDRRLLISLSALLFVLPWLWMKRIGVLSYTRYSLCNTQVLQM